MFRRTDIAMITLMIGVVGYTYSVKTGTKDVVEQLASIQRETESEINAIDLLNADWEVLTAPKRIQSLVNVYQSDLNLVATDARRMISITEIPMRAVPVTPETNIDDILAQYSDADSSLTTGSITPAKETKTQKAKRKPEQKPEQKPSVDDILEGNGLGEKAIVGDQ